MVTAFGPMHPSLFVVQPRCKGISEVSSMLGLLSLYIHKAMHLSALLGGMSFSAEGFFSRSDIDPVFVLPIVKISKL